jgi:hypothetical protein
MSRRPLTITITGWLFVVVGVLSLGRQVLDLSSSPPGLVSSLPQGFWYAAITALAAGLGGVFIVYGANWARWLLAAWLALHVVLSAFHGAFKLVVHTGLAVLVLWLLFRECAAAWFRADRRPAPRARDI